MSNNGNGKVSINGRPLFGDQWAQLRAEISKLGGVWNGKTAMWIMPTAVLEQVRDRLPEGTLPQPMKAPPAPPAEQTKLPLPAATAPPAPPAPQVQAKPATSTRRVMQIPECVCILGKVRVVGAVEHRRLDEKVDTQELERGDKKIKRRDTIRTTQRIVTDVEEREAAEKLANQIRYSVKELGYHPDLGPICPLEKQDEMLAILQKADEAVAKWNLNSRYHHLVMTYELGVMTSAPERAARTIAFDFGQVLAKLKEALGSADVEAIRAQATFMAARIKGLENVLPERDQGLLKQAIDGARRAASYMKEQIEEKGRQVSSVLEEVSLEPVESARMAFLEYAMPEGLENVAAGAVEESRFGELGDIDSVGDLETPVAVDTERFSGLA